MNAVEIKTPEQLRSERGLRALTSEEEGTAVRDLPAGVFGFSWSPSFESTPLFARKAYRAFEVHKLTDGTVALVGYKVAQVDDADRITLYPDPWESATRLVSVPLDRMVHSTRTPARENGCPYLIELK